MCSSDLLHAGGQHSVKDGDDFPENCHGDSGRRLSDGWYLGDDRPSDCPGYYYCRESNIGQGDGTLLYAYFTEIRS